MTVKSDEEAGLELGQFKFPLCMTTSLTWYTVEPARLAPSLKSGLSNVLPFNEENILKLRLDSNKRLAKALQAARDYM